MSRSLSRRELLRAGATLPLIETMNRPSSARTRKKQTISGRIVGPDENPIEDATIWFFTADAGMAPAFSDSAGRFEIPALDSEFTVVARKGRWFTKETFSAGTTQHTFHLHNELLFDPTIARTNNYGIPIGLVSFWRYVGPPPHTDQVFYIEITNLNEPDPNWGISSWDIEHKAGFKSGLFTFTFPEDDVLVDYGSISPEIDLADYAPAYDHFGGAVKIVGVNAKKRSEDELPLVDFHPLRPDRPTLPAYVLASHIGWDEGRWNPETPGFQTLSTARAQKEQVKRQGIKKIIGALPLLGQAGYALDLFDWALDNQVSGQGSVGQDIDPLNPNTMDTVTKAWKSDNQRLRVPGEASITVRIPVRFKEETSGNTSFTAQAEWAGAGLFSTDGYFGHQVSRSPSIGGGDWPEPLRGPSGTRSSRTATGPSPPIERRWSFNHAESISHPSVAGGTVYLGSYDTNVYALDAATGEVLDNWPFEKATGQTTVPAVANDTVYIGSLDENVYAVDASTGTLRNGWPFPQAESWVYPVVGGETVYVGGADTNVYAVDAQTGSLRDGWPFAEAADTTYLSLGTDSVFVGTDFDDTNAYAIDGETGEEKWRFANATGRNYIAVSNKRVYIANDAAEVYAIDARTGDERWVFKTGDKSVVMPWATAETVYAGTADGNVYALDAATGELRTGWPFELPEDVTPHIAVANNTVYIMNQARGRTVYAIDATTGNEQWRYNHVFGEKHGPVVSANTLYVVDEKTVASGATRLQALQ